MYTKKKGKGNPVILVVEDTARVRQAITYVLEKKDYKILNAHDAYQAQSMVKESLPDLLLLDVMMPGLDGYELCKKLKEHPETKNIPVVFLTAKTKPADVLKGFEAGAVDYIKKPYNSDELLARIENHLENKKTKDREKELLEEVEFLNKKIETLSGLIPICIHCKKIRVDKQYRNDVKAYLERYSPEELNKSICGECEKKIPSQEKKKKNDDFMEFFRF